MDKRTAVVVTVLVVVAGSIFLPELAAVAEDLMYTLIKMIG